MRRTFQDPAQAVGRLQPPPQLKAAPLAVAALDLGRQRQLAVGQQKPSSLFLQPILPRR